MKRTKHKIRYVFHDVNVNQPLECEKYKKYHWTDILFWIFCWAMGVLAGVIWS